jgi:hypothetical protein
MQQNGKKCMALLLMVALLLMLSLAPVPVFAKGDISDSDTVKNVLVYAKNKQGQDILLSILSIDSLSGGGVNNYSIIDQFPTVVHQEAEGLSVEALLDVAASASGVPGANDVTFYENDKVAFWEIDGNAFDGADTYTWKKLYDTPRFNFPALYANWQNAGSGKKAGYIDDAAKDAIRASAEPSQVILSVRAFSERYMLTEPDGSVTDMEGYFSSRNKLDSARSLRLMLPMTMAEFENATPTAMNSRYGICYIRFESVAKPDMPSQGTVAAPKYEYHSDGDTGYFSLSCDTEGATILYNDNAVSSYMPTAIYTGGEIDVPLNGGKAVLNVRAVKPGYVDSGVKALSGSSGSSSGTGGSAPGAAPGAPAVTASGEVPPVGAPAGARTVTKADQSHISGANRIATSVAISRQGWSTSETVIIGPGGSNNLIDVLAVAPLAGQWDAPILLSLGDELDQSVLTEIKRLSVSKVILVGALSGAVAAQVQAAVPEATVEVLKGQSRWETAALVGAKVTEPKGVLVVGYNAVADAVSVAPWAAANGYTIALANADGSWSKPEGTVPGYIIGGPTLVKDVTGFPRIYGADRYATNKAIRDTLIFDYTHIYTADGGTLVDALTGSVLAARTKSAIVLAPGNDPAGIDFGDITTETKVYAFGG